MRGSASAESLRPLSVSADAQAFGRVFTRRIGEPPRSRGARDCVNISRRIAALKRAGPRSLRAVSAHAPIDCAASPLSARTIGRPAMPPTPSCDGAALVRDRRDRDDGEVAMPARHFVEGHALALDDRKAHGGDQLIGAARACSACPSGTPRRRRHARRLFASAAPPSRRARRATSGSSELGSAWAMEPHTVPLLRV